jgi:acyl carrier protein
MDREARPVRAFIVERLAPATGRTDLDDHDDLIDSGVFQLVAFLEERFGIAIPDSDITPDNFATIARIERLVADRGR